MTQLTTVLFDLDGTLLPMDQDRFVRAYFGLLVQKLAPRGYEPKALLQGILSGMEAMLRNDGRQYNRDAFWREFARLFGEAARADEPAFEEFYRVEFQDAKAACGFAPQAAETVQAIRRRGLRTVLATNPLFPPVATESRVRWAGLEPSDFEWITTYDNTHFCKPNPAYYAEILRGLGLRAEECLMVGNDTGDDLPAASLGMRVFLLTDCLINKNGCDVGAWPHGGFDALRAYIDGQLA